MTAHFRLILSAMLIFAFSEAGMAQDRPTGQSASGQPTGPPARGVIAGSVVEADTGAPIATATIAVWRQRDSTLVTGAVTEQNGRFMISGIRGGVFYVRVSFVGFETQTVTDVRVGSDAMQVDLGTIRLAVVSEELEEVVITEERGQVQIQIDRTVYSTADDAIASGGSAANVLETIPSVDVDIDGNISLRGSANVAVLINGRPAPVTGEFLPAYLQSLPAGSIDKVEVIPNPSARYDPEGMAGIINIVLKENTDRGIGGTVSTGLTTQGGYSGSAAITYGKGPWNLAATYGLRHDVRDATGESYRINRYLSPLTFLDQDEIEDRTRSSNLVNLTAEYSFTPKTVLTSSAQIGARSGGEVEVNSFVFLDAESAPTLAYERIVDEQETGWNTDVRLGLSHAFGAERGEKEHTLKAEVRLDASTDDEEVLYTETFLDNGDAKDLQRSVEDREHRDGSLQVDYVRPVGAYRIEAGYKGDLDIIDATFFSETLDPLANEFVADVGLNNVFDYREEIHAFYGQVGREYGALGVQAGIRFETVTTDFTLQNTGETFANDYTSMFPSLFLIYELSEANILKASYSRRINRPRTRMLNPFPSYDDPLNQRIGNPALQPEYVDAFELGYVRYLPWGSLTFTPYFRRTTDVMRWIQTLREDGVTVRSFENLDTSDSYGLEFISSVEGGKLVDGLRGYVSLEGFKVVTEGTSGDTDLANDAFGWGGRVNASYEIGDTGLGGLDVQTTLFYRAPMNTEQGRMGSRTFLNIAFRQKLLNDKGSLSLQLRDPLKLAGFNFVYDQPELYRTFERDWGAQEIGLTFSYSFGRQDRRANRDRQGGPNGGGGGGEDMDGGG